MRCSALLATLALAACAPATERVYVAPTDQTVTIGTERYNYRYSWSWRRFDAPETPEG